MTQTQQTTAVAAHIVIPHGCGHARLAVTITAQKHASGILMWESTGLWAGNRRNPRPKGKRIPTSQNTTLDS